MDNSKLNLPLTIELLECLPIPLCLRDRRSRYVWVNRAFESAFGRPRSELVGMSDFDLLPHEQALLEQMRDERVFRTEQDVFFEDRTDCTGALRGVTGWHLAIRGADDRIAYSLRQWGSLGGAATGPIFGDPSVDPLEESQPTQTQQLREERLLVLGQLAGPLAHQLGNPLCSMGLAIANVRRMLGKTASTDTRDALTSAEESVAIADRIIKDLLTYSKIRPPSLRSTTVSSLADTAQSKAPLPPGVVLKNGLGEELVLVDARQVSDAIANLITSACEALSAQGTLAITSGELGEFIHLTIGDAAEEPCNSRHAPPFEPLIPSKDLGIGFGLTTARALILNQGGTLEYRPQEKGDGALFRVLLRPALPIGPRSEAIETSGQTG